MAKTSRRPARSPKKVSKPTKVKCPDCEKYQSAILALTACHAEIVIESLQVKAKGYEMGIRDGHAEGYFDGIEEGEASGLCRGVVYSGLSVMVLGVIYLLTRTFL